MSDVVIKVENLWKEYRLGVVNHGTLKRDLQSWWARVHGQDDPNTRIDVNAATSEAPDRFWALRDVSFDVRQGEVLGIIGRNGAGKSTLLKILSRVTTPTKGEVKIRGRVASLLEVGTGFHPELTGRENIFLNGAILGMSKAEIRAKLDEIVDFSGVEKFIDTPVKRYSSGMYVRLAFAVAAHLDPEILIIDEVLAVGDAEFQKKCLGKMGEVAKGGRTVLFVSHNMGAVTKLCSVSMLLDQGASVFYSDTRDVVEYYYKKAKIINEKRIVDSVVICENILQIKSIRMNDSESSTVTIGEDEHVLKLEICGELSSDAFISAEMILRDTNDQAVAIFLPGHIYGCSKKIPKGNFVVVENIEIPRNLNHGTFSVDLSMSIPGVAYFMKALSCASITLSGLKTSNGNVFNYEQNGIVSLLRA